MGYRSRKGRNKAERKTILQWNKANKYKILACIRKKKRSRAEAKKYAEKNGMYYYKCPYCREYHVTKQKRIEQKSIEEYIKPIINALIKSDNTKENE